MNSILNSISYHAVYDGTINEAILYAKENGFAGIQIADESPHLSFERLSTEQAEEIRLIAQQKNIYLTLHAVDNAASLFQPNQYLSAGIRDYYAALFGFAHKVSARLVTIHLGEMTSFPTDTQPEYRIPREDIAYYHHLFKKNINHLSSINDGTILICIENSSLDQASLDILFPYLERGDFFLCWDLAKSFGQPELEDFFFNHLAWVKQVHLHDRRRNPDNKTRTHCVIGTGEIDFGSYLSVLSNGKVEDFCIEVRPREKAKESLEALKTVI